MRIMWIGLAIAAVVASPVSAQQAPWGEFSVHAILARTSTRVEIGMERIGPQGSPEYRFRGEIIDRYGAPARVVWADTRSCPGSVDQLRAL